MNYRKLGRTGLMVSEIGLGAEWLERHTTEEVKAVIDHCRESGINILDCWMPGPKVRSDIGKAIAGDRDHWIIQGHLGSTWQGGQYVRTRDVAASKVAFADLLERFGTDHIELGMMNYIDQLEDLDHVLNGPFYAWAEELKRNGVIRHIGLSTHNPVVAITAAEAGAVDMMLYSVNPAYDLMGVVDDAEKYYGDHSFDAGGNGMDPIRAKVYRTCESLGVGITVMKAYAGGRLFDEKVSPFGVAMTPVQCLHYALTRPAVASVMVGYDTVEHVDAALAYETASAAARDYASVLASAPHHPYGGQCTYCGHCAPCPAHIDIAMVNKLYDLAAMQPQVPDGVRAHYAALEANATHCVGCGGCETRCPFQVPVVQRMKKARELFD